MEALSQEVSCVRFDDVCAQVIKMDTRSENADTKSMCPGAWTASTLISVLITYHLVLLRQPAASTPVSVLAV